MTASELIEHLNLLIKAGSLETARVLVVSEGPWGTTTRDIEGIWLEGNDVHVSLGTTLQEFYDMGYHQGREDSDVPAEGDAG